MNKNAKIYVAGHTGMVGSAITKNLVAKGYTNIIGKTFEELDLTNQQAVRSFFDWAQPEYVILAAAKVGGIVANNTYRAQFIYENLAIQNNIIHEAYTHGVKKLLFLGSTCIYPRMARQPMHESELLTGVLEYTNEPYAMAKIAGIKMCESYNLQYGTNFLSVMPTNLYGPNDNFNLETSHVLPALVRKMHLGKCLVDENWDALRQDLDKRPIAGVNGKAETSEILNVLEKMGVCIIKEDKSLSSESLKDQRKAASFISVKIWGSGKPMREFLWSEEMADACVFVMENTDFEDVLKQQLNDNTSKEVRNTHINIGTGKEISIGDLAVLIKEKVGFNGEIIFDTAKPDGTMRKLTNVNKLHALGWRHQIEVSEGVEKLYDWYING